MSIGHMPKGEVLCTHFDEGVMYQKDKSADSQVYKCSVTKATLSLHLILIFITVKLTGH